MFSFYHQGQRLTFEAGGSKTPRQFLLHADVSAGRKF